MRVANLVVVYQASGLITTLNRDIGTQKTGWMRLVKLSVFSRDG